MRDYIPRSRSDSSNLLAVIKRFNTLNILQKMVNKLQGSVGIKNKNNSEIRS